MIPFKRDGILTPPVEAMADFIVDWSDEGMASSHRGSKRQAVSSAEGNKRVARVEVRPWKDEIRKSTTFTLPPALFDDMARYMDGVTEFLEAGGAQPFMVGEVINFGVGGQSRQRLLDLPPERGPEPPVDPSGTSRLCCWYMRTTLESGMAVHSLSAIPAGVCSTPCPQHTDDIEQQRVYAHANECGVQLDETHFIGVRCLSTPGGQNQDQFLAH